MEIKATLIGSFEALKEAKAYFEDYNNYVKGKKDLIWNFEAKSTEPELNSKIEGAKAFEPLNEKSAENANTKINQP